MELENARIDVQQLLVSPTVTEPITIPDAEITHVTPAALETTDWLLVGQLMPLVWPEVQTMSQMAQQLRQLNVEKTEALSQNDHDKAARLQEKEQDLEKQAATFIRENLLPQMIAAIDALGSGDAEKVAAENPLFTILWAAGDVKDIADVRQRLTALKAKLENK